MRLLMIRHGQTTSNVDRLLDTGVPGAPLTSLGQQQAEQLAITLAGDQIEAIVSSDLLRTQQTSRPLADARGLEPLLTSDWREVTAGELEMRNDADAIERYRDTVYSWAAGDLDAAMPGGESGTEVLARLDRAVAFAIEQGEQVVLVGHGTSTRLWLSTRTANFPAGDLRATLLLNTAVVSVDSSDGRSWSITSWRNPPEVAALGNHPTTTEDRA